MCVCVSVLPLQLLAPGQRQLLACARLCYHADTASVRLAVLDEGTASLDAKAEQAVRGLLFGLVAGHLFVAVVPVVSVLLPFETMHDLDSPT